VAWPRPLRLHSRGRNVSRWVNSIDAYFDGKRWWIASVVWQSESPRYPIPAELLPPPGGR
jgi:hypothetical protein